MIFCYHGLWTFGVFLVLHSALFHLWKHETHNCLVFCCSGQHPVQDSHSPYEHRPAPLDSWWVQIITISEVSVVLQPPSLLLGRKKSIGAAMYKVLKTLQEITEPQVTISSILSDWETMTADFWLGRVGTSADRHTRGRLDWGPGALGLCTRTSWLRSERGTVSTYHHLSSCHKPSFPLHFSVFAILQPSP